MTKHTAPLVTAMLLLLPLLYVGSYYAMVVPFWGMAHYRYGGQTSVRMYWPVEQLDRKLRPSFWQTAAWQTLPTRPSPQMFLCPTHWTPPPGNVPANPPPLE